MLSQSTRVRLNKNSDSDLFSKTAHELKTPITTLKLLTHIYLHRNKKGRAQVSMDELQTMDRELDRLTTMVDDLLDATTTGNGKMNMRLQVVDLTSHVNDIVKQMRMLTKGHEIEFAPVKGIKILTDPDRLTQVLMNLLTNASKYSAQNMPIRINVRKSQNRVVVSVQDQGKGISKHVQSKVFQRYYQEDKQSTTGKGLGLYITKEIIDNLKGKIWLTSKINKGSTFSFSLPFTA